MSQARNLYDPAFWTAAAERAVRTLAQALLAAISTGAAGLLDVNWTAAFSIAGLAAVLSVLTSVASAKSGRTGPSLGGAETTEKTYEQV